MLRQFKKGDDMKRLIVVISVLISVIFVFSANAQDPPFEKKIKIMWEDKNQKTEDFRWLLFMRGQDDVFADDPVLTIPIAETAFDDPDYTSPGTLIITGEPGGSVTKFFAMKAQRGQGDTEETSDMSQESNPVTFTIPLSAPYELRIQILIVPE